MSRTIDERVVEMRFDNQQFEKNAQTSISTLNKLKQSLKLESASKGLESVNTAVKKCDVSPMADAIDTVRVKFSALDVAAYKAISNIVDSAMRAGERIISALTIDPVKSGFEEYETQINAIQTILANTESKGSTLQDVNAALDELNHYADMTIYNFTEMTRNIGTFTAAGVDLDTSVSAIKGIANLAAVSGSTSQQASTAMYQLSQALAAGTVKLQDWNSVVNAGMGGQVFQDALKDTARVHGIAIDSMIEKEGSFRETLQKGWLSSDILTETLSKFTGDLTEAQLKSMGYADDQVKSIIKMGQTANDAATKVKTLTQLWDTLKEAAQSGWTKTWQLVVGDFDEAKELYTNISDTVSEFLNKSSDRRNDLLEGALLSNWGKLKNAIGEAGVETSKFEEKVKEVAITHGYNIEGIIEQYGSLGNAFRDGALSTMVLRDALNQLNGKMVDLSEVQRVIQKSDTGEDVKKVQEALQSLNFDIGSYGVDGILGSATESAIKAFQEANKLEVTGIVDEATLAALQEACTTTSIFGENISDLIDEVTELGGREKLIESFKNVFKALSDVVAPVKDAFSEVFPQPTVEQLTTAIDKIHEFTGKLKVSEETADKIKRSFKGVFSILAMFKKGIIAILSPIGKFIGDGGLNGIASGILNVSAIIGDTISSINESNGMATFLQSVSNGIYSVFNDLASFIAPGLNEIESIEDVFEYVSTGVATGVKKISENLQNLYNRFRESETVKKYFSAILPYMDSFKETIGEAKSHVINFIESIKMGDFESVKSKIEGLMKSLLPEDGTFDSFGDAFDYIKTAIYEKVVSAFEFCKSKVVSFGDSFTTAKETILNALDGIKTKISEIVDWIGEHVSGKAVSTGLAGVGIFSIFKKIFNTIKSIRSFFKGDKDGNGLKDDVSDVLQGMSKSLKAFTKSIKVASIVGIASAILILSLAMKNIASLNTTQILTSLGAIGLLMTEIMIPLRLLNDSSGTVQSGAGMLLAVMALNKIINVIKKMGTIEEPTLTQGLLAIGVVLVELMVTISIMNKMSNITGNDVLKTGASILLMAISLKSIASAIKKIGNIKLEGAIQGVVAIGVVLAEMLVVLGVMIKFNSMGSLFSAAAIAIMAVSLGEIADALATLGKMEWDQIKNGLIGIGVTLIELGAVSTIVGSIGSGLPALAGSGAIAIAASGLGDIANALKILGEMEWEQIKNGLIGMGAALSETALGSLLNTFSGWGASSIQTVAEPLGTLAESVKKWTAITVPEGLGEDLGSLGDGVKAFNFSGFGAGAISKLAEPLGTLASSVSQWTDITVPDGLGDQLTDLAPGIKAFNFSGFGASAISKLAGPLGDLADSVIRWTGVVIPSDIASQLGDLADGVKKFNFSGWGAGSIADMASPLGDLANSVAAWSNVVVPDNMEAVLGGLARGVQAWNILDYNYIPSVVANIEGFADEISKWNGVTISDSLPTNLQGLVTAITECNDISLDSFDSICTGLTNVGTVVTDMLNIDFDSAASKLSAFADSISNLNISTDGFTDLGGSVIDKFTSAMSDRSGSMSDVGSSLISGLVSGMEQSNSVSSAISSIISSASSSAKDSQKDFVSLGSYMVSGFVSGIRAKLSDSNTAGKSLTTAGISGARENYNDFYSAGSYAGSGFINGMRSQLQAAARAGAEIANAAKNATKSTLDEHSPSKVFHKIGDFAGLGFVNGLNSYRDASSKAGASIATSAREGLAKAISKANDIVQNGVNDALTIRPVLDLSAVEAGAGRINGIIGASQSVPVSSNIRAISSMMNDRQTANKNDDVVSAIGKLQKSLGNRSGDSYVINGITYDDGSNIADAMQTIVRAARQYRRG